MTFTQRVLDSIKYGATVYKSVFLDFEYLIYSPDFTVNPYYIIHAYEDNYAHLTGVNSLIPAKDFFLKCYDGTIKESDFNFIKGRKSEKSTKGSVREKIISLPEISSFFTTNLQAEEDFAKGKVHCHLATADNKITIGFSNANKAVPQTLLRRNQLNFNKTVNVALVLRRNKDSDKFDTIIQGDISGFASTFPGLIDEKILF